MTTETHYLSFSDHLGLYMPHFLRPPLPRDLRPMPISEQVPPTPIPTPSHGADAMTVVEAATPTYSPPEHENAAAKKAREDGHARRIQEALLKGGLKEKSGQCLSREGYHVSLILTNSGSVARDHLASERTFLAYVRTSLAMASTGVALVQLFTIAMDTGAFRQGSTQQLVIRDFATPLGSTLIVFGLILLLLGCLRYFAIQMALTRGVFPAARLTVVFIVVTLSVLTGIVFGVLVRGRRT